MKAYRIFEAVLAVVILIMVLPVFLLGTLITVFCRASPTFSYVDYQVSSDRSQRFLEFNIADGALLSPLMKSTKQLPSLLLVISGNLRLSDLVYSPFSR